MNNGQAVENKPMAATLTTEQRKALAALAAGAVVIQLSWGEDTAGVSWQLSDALRPLRYETQPGRCRCCGAGLVQPVTGRRRRYCASRCRQVAYRRRRAARVATMREHGMGEYVPVLWLDYRSPFP